MMKSIFKLIIIESFLLIALLLNNLVINAYKGYSLILILGIILFVSIIWLGYEKDHHRFKKDIVLNTLIYTLSFQILIYLAGLFLGFIENGYNLTIINVIENILPVVIIIILSEILRYELNIKGEKNKIVIGLSVLIFVIIDITLQVHLYDLHLKREIFEMISLVLLPSISKNLLLTYYSLNFGWLPSITYRFIMELPIYFISIFPNLNIYLQSMILLLFPIFIFYRTNKILKGRVISIKRKSLINKIVINILIILILVSIYLISGVFKEYLLAVGSNSMSPYIKRGDSIIVEKINKKELKELKENDVLVYKHNNMIIIHRIREIQYINHKYYFRTKGDANLDEDIWTINEIDVIGKVLYRMPLIGYPTVWFNESLDGGKNE